MHCERGVHEFDAWASAFGDTRTELELQPSGAYKPVERFSDFINVPELIDMFRSVADVVLKDDLRRYLKLPRIRAGSGSWSPPLRAKRSATTRSTWRGASRRSSSARPGCSRATTSCWR